MNKTQANPIWNFLCSVKLTIFILILLAATSIIGTIIPQGEAGEEFIKNISPALQKIIISFHLYDMYHSAWFQLIIFILALNLIACSMNKIPGTIRLFKKLPSPDREKIFTNIHPDRIIKSRLNKNDTANVLREIISRHYTRIAEKDTENRAYFYGDKGRYSMLGVYLVHFSVLLILVGAIIGSIFGFKGYVNILEGESIDYITPTGVSSHSHIDLGFTVSCDRFSVEFYDNGQPKEYKSDIRFSVDGNTVKQGHLLVNHPLTFMGITFYQNSYGVLSGDEASIIVNQKGHEDPVRMKIIRGKGVPLPESGGEIILEEIRDDFMRMGPAVKIHVKPVNSEGADIWLFKNYEDIRERFSTEFDQFPQFNPSIIEPYTFSLDGIESAYYTGLQVNKDPGIPFIYAGFFIIVIGLIVTFFTSFRHIWIKIDGSGDMISLYIAGTANKNPVGLDRELDQITNQLNLKLNRNNNI
ncbi:MAG: cytochrome c biogenesis protein ResB [Deltaproteobacteria bacterium]|nr:cytochrome c biogenesis protein ResB [Deltaproteobacteria bacterium]